VTITQAPDQGLKIGSREEFEKLFRAHYSELCAFANGFLRDVAASEDVVQEVLLKVWTSKDTLEITTSVRSYLFRAVRNSCMNVIKHLGIREQYRETGGSTAGSDHGPDTLVFSELQQKIRTAIDRLPVERKKVFILSRYEGLTYSQIAEKLGISVKTVENQMSRALQFMREELHEYLPLLLLLFAGLFENN